MIKTLKSQAGEIAGEGRAGWRNTMLDAAEMLESLPCRVAGYTLALCCSLLDEGKDPRQTEAPEIIRKITAAFISEKDAGDEHACQKPTDAEVASNLFRRLAYYRKLMPVCVGMSESSYSATQEAINADDALCAYAASKLVWLPKESLPCQPDVRSVPEQAKSRKRDRGEQSVMFVGAETI